MNEPLKMRQPSSCRIDDYAETIFPPEISIILSHWFAACSFIGAICNILAVKKIFAAALFHWPLRKNYV